MWLARGRSPYSTDHVVMAADQAQEKGRALHSGEGTTKVLYYCVCQVGWPPNHDSGPNPF